MLHNAQTFYDTNIYYKTCEQYNLKEVLPKGTVIFGEVYGEGIQKNYNYGLKGETKLVVFDVQVVDENGKFIGGSIELEKYLNDY